MAASQRGAMMAVEQVAHRITSALGQHQRSLGSQTLRLKPLWVIVRMLKPSVGEMLRTSSPSTRFTIVVLPALSRPLPNNAQYQHSFDGYVSLAFD